MRTDEKGKRIFKSAAALLLGLLLVLSLACSQDPTSSGGGGNNNGGGGGEDEPYCLSHHTANVTFGNESRHSTYDIIFDGARLEPPLGPGQTTARTVAAGQHTIRFRFSNTGNYACLDATPNLAICDNQTYSCNSDQ